MRKQLRAEADAQHGLVLSKRSFDREQLGLQVRVAMLVHHVHRPAEYDEPMVSIGVRLRVGMALEIVEANAVTAGADASMQRTERFGGHVLEDHQSGHVLAILRWRARRCNWDSASDYNACSFRRACSTAVSAGDS